MKRLKFEPKLHAYKTLTTKYIFAKLVLINLWTQNPFIVVDFPKG